MTSTDIVPVGAGALGIIGLEDFDEADMIMPTLRLGANQDAGFIINGLSNEKMTELECVVLGIVKGRILWAADIEEGKQLPLCRSYEFAHGWPNMPEFPWTASGFAVPQMDAPQEILNCGDCRLKEFGTNPKSEAPWCAEQHHYVILYKVINEDGSVLVPAIFTIQRSAMKASRKYMSAFAQSKSPMFVTSTKITCETQKRGSVDYTVPVFTRGTPIPAEYYQGYADQFRRIRATLQTPRMIEPDETPVAAPASNVHTPAPAASQPAPATPAPQTVPDVPPAATPQNPVPPATPAPAPTQAETPAASAPAPAAVAVPVVPDAPLVPDAVTSPPAASPTPPPASPAPAPNTVPGQPGDGDLPF